MKMGHRRHLEDAFWKKRFLLLGVGGIGMSALARMILCLGGRVIGCDKNYSEQVKSLEDEGVIFCQEEDAQINMADIIIYSNAISQEHFLIQSGKEEGKEVIRRGEFLSRIVSKMDSIVITGTHGKTTTTMMLGHFLGECEKDPMVYCGGICIDRKTNFFPGKGELLVAEVDESDRSFIYMIPKILILPTLEHDHVDEYPEEKDKVVLFKKYLLALPEDSLGIVNTLDKGLKNLIEEVRLPRERWRFVGKDDDCDYKIIDSYMDSKGVTYSLKTKDHIYGPFFLSMTGEHNLINSALAVVASLEINVDVEPLKRALKNFPGVKRRMEYLGYLGDRINVYTDYAHHPTEIKAVLKAFRFKEKGKKLWGVFEPHRFSRLTAFFDEFIKALKGFDGIIISDFHRAGEEGDEKGLKTLLMEQLEKDTIVHQVENKKILTWAKEKLTSKDVVIILGAGKLDSVIRNTFSTQEHLC